MVMKKWKDNPSAPWEVGANYFIRTVTHHYTGKLVAVHQAELVLVDAAWIADDGKLCQAFPDARRVIVGRGSLIDAQKIEKLPRSEK